MSQFSFLETEFPRIYEFAHKAEQRALSDPRGACLYARLALETLIKWIFKEDTAFSAFDERSSIPLAELTESREFENLAGKAVFYKARFVREIGNRAAHNIDHPPSQRDAVNAVGELFHITYWFARTYAKGKKPIPSLQFAPNKLEESLIITASTVQEIKQLRTQYDKEAARRKELEEQALNTEDKRREHRDKVDKAREEVKRLREENDKTKDHHNYNEAQTRRNLIDLFLQEAGWENDRNVISEVRVTGMPNDKNEGFVDYVLWGEDGKPLGLIEAKRTKIDPQQGQHQAKLYADCLERQYHQRPLIFYTNGYEHWFWDDKNYPPRQIQGFFTPDELKLNIQRRTLRRSLNDIPINKDIVDRPYQERAIRNIDAAFMEKRRKALLVMATGTGKTRTAVALVGQLTQANWVKNALFLTDRVALVKQAHNAFKQHLPNIPGADLLDRKNGQDKTVNEARILFSTYPTMMNCLDHDEGASFDPGHFDLVIIDEAHRSIYQKYRSIFTYFDSLLLGLTATPRDTIHHDTYKMFDLEQGQPTDCYDIDDAVHDGYLVPPQMHPVQSLFQQEGIDRAKLTADEQERWEEADWKDDETIVEHDHIAASKVNKIVLNTDTVDKSITILMEKGLCVDDGDKLGKTIIFARNKAHADFIVERFNILYPSYKGKFAKKIYSSLPYAQNLLDEFKTSSEFQIAVSVDMLDTGVDIPSIVNLVFFKPIYSPTKFIQMVGRGTRICKDLFGPGQDKEKFIIFDYFDNLKTFMSHCKENDDKPTPPLKTRIFTARLHLLQSLQNDNSCPEIQNDIKNTLYNEVQTLSSNNPIVRQHQRSVSTYQDPKNWEHLSKDDFHVLESVISQLPFAYQDEEGSTPASREFDLLIYRTELAILQNKTYVKNQKKITEIASYLEDKQNIPAIKKQLPLIEKLQTDIWWQNVTINMLEEVRRKLRLLVCLVDPKERHIIYTDFQDTVSQEPTENEISFATGINKKTFKQEALRFMDKYKNNISLIKLRRGIALTRQDLSDLEHMFRQEKLNEISDMKNPEEFAHFLRSLRGMDRTYVSEAFKAFTAKHHFSANQIRFIELVIDNLCKNGFVEPENFYDAPFTDMNDQGISGLFDVQNAKEIIHITNQFNKIVA